MVQFHQHGARRKLYIARNFYNFCNFCNIYLFLKRPSFLTLTPCAELVILDPSVLRYLFASQQNWLSMDVFIIPFSKISLIYVQFESGRVQTFVLECNNLNGLYSQDISRHRLAKAMWRIGYHPECFSKSLV
jgi:hypothetical protein